MKHSRVLLLVFCALCSGAVLTGCGTAQQPAATSEDMRAQAEAAVRAAALDWGKAVTARDIDQTLSFYADDAWVYPQNAPIAMTAEARRSVWEKFFATPGLAHMDGKTARVEAADSGDLAVEYGNFAMVTEDPGGKTNTVAEKYVTAWKKQPDGSWKVIADIWNTDQ